MHFVQHDRLIVIVGTILISAGELGKGAEAGKGAPRLWV